MAAMVELTSHDASVLTRLVQFYGLPAEKRQRIFTELKSPEARQVGEAILEPDRLSDFPEPIQATAIRYTQWLENNMRRGRLPKAIRSR